MNVVVEQVGDNLVLVIKDNLMRPMPAGDRLFRGGEFPPGMKFVHTDVAEATLDAVRLTKYLADPHKKPSKSQQQKAAL